MAALAVAAARRLSTMASREAWSERSGSDKRRTLGGFGILYLLICLVGLGLGWTLVALVFGLGAVGLGIAWFTTPEDAAGPDARPKPEWMRAMDDPTAPDLTRAEYRDGPPTEVAESTPTGEPTEQPTTPPEAPPSPTS